MTTSYKTYFDRYKELSKQYNITKNPLWHIPYDQRRLLDADVLKARKQKIIEKYDVVVECIGTGYAHKKYRVLRNKPLLSTLDLAIICDDGNLCFGYRTEGSVICVHTD